MQHLLILLVFLMDVKMKISHSKIRSYSTCGKQYEFHYIKKWRNSIAHGAFLYGIAIDNALNTLLLTKNLEEAKEVFEKNWAIQNINDVATPLKFAENVAYGKKDFDGELLTQEDIESFKNACNINDYAYSSSDQVVNISIELLKEKKSQVGINNMTLKERKLLSYGHWLSLRRKGYLMLEAYNVRIMPQIEEVLEVQKYFEIKNNDGDSITGIIDTVLKMKDGRVFIIDNKTSTRLYECDSAGKSQQLILYKHAYKEHSVDGVGFIVLYKQMKKNRTKICSVCSHDGSEGRHKTCANEINGKRCGGAWNEKIVPECEIDIILNIPTSFAEKLVMEAADKANEGIKAGIFVPNLQSCGSLNSDFCCPFFRVCWNGDQSHITELSEKKILDKTGWL